MKGNDKLGYDRQSELVYALLCCNKQYNLGEEYVADATFDKWEKELKKLAPHHPYFKMVGWSEKASKEVSNWETRRNSLKNVKWYLTNDCVSNDLIEDIIDGCQELPSWFALIEDYENQHEERRTEIINEFKELL